MGGAETQTRSHAGRETRHYLCHRSLCFGSGHKVFRERASATAGADGKEASTLAQVSTLKVLFRNRLLRTFVLPIDRQYPPATAVVEKLNAIYPADERGGVVWIVGRLLC